MVCNRNTGFHGYGNPLLVAHTRDQNGKLSQRGIGLNGRENQDSRQGLCFASLVAVHESIMRRMLRNFKNQGTLKKYLARWYY